MGEEREGGKRKKRGRVEHEIQGGRTVRRERRVKRAKRVRGERVRE
jgi:hypothetical protein